MRAWRIFLVLAAAGCGSPSAPGSDEIAVLVGAGDIAVCNAGGSMATGRLLDNLPGTIFVAGDIAYPDGSAEQFRTCFEPAWGRHKGRIRPSPGNHEYGSPGAAPYFEYFGAAAGPPGLGYYRYRLGAWQVFSLNSNSEGGSRVSQLDWLRSELAAPGGSPCAVAYFHHPRFSSGPHGTVPPAAIVPDLWQALYTSGVDVVISAHEHFYERFARQSPSAAPDHEFGIRQFVVGTGGAPLTQPLRRVANSETVVSAYGLLRLTLEPQSYRWEFLSAEGGAVMDSGSDRCHGRP